MTKRKKKANMNEKRMKSKTKEIYKKIIVIK